MKKGIIAFALCAVLATALLPFRAHAEEDDINLAAGLDYTVSTGEPASHSYAHYTEGGAGFDVDDGKLTDSKTALASESSAGWYRAFRAQSRIVGFDLGAECAVSAIKAGFLNVKSSGIYAPRYLRVYLSHDGEKYTQIYQFDNDFPIYDATPARNDVEFELPGRYLARYIRVEFCCDIFCYCDEIEIIGSRTVTGTEVEFADSDPQPDPGVLTEISGVNDIIKIYNGYFKPDQAKALVTAEMLLPYIGYLSANGEIADTMFDSVAFVPCHTDYPSGGRLVKTNGKPGAVQTDWELYSDYLFAEGYDLHALDEAVGEVYEKLGRTEKFKVFLTMPYPTVLPDKPFGDIDGDGEDDYCRTLEERSAILEWYTGKLTKSFSEADFRHLELAGFYWYREEINYSDSDHEAELVRGFNEYAQSLGYSTLFDPFYLSTGFDHWESLGFTGAVMQPNVAFASGAADYFEIEMLDEFSQTVKRRRLGVEIETDEPSILAGNDYHAAGKNYESYLYYGAKNGYMSAVKTYYQGAGPGTIYDFCHADVSTPKGKYLRRLYDLTYSFIKGEYKNLPPEVAVEDFETVSGSRRNLVDLLISDDDSYWGDITVSFPTLPQHGNVTDAAGKRQIVYNADADFVGEDFFTVVVSDGFNMSEEITVRVTVVAPAEASDDGHETSGSDSPGTDPVRKQPVPGWLIALVIVLGLAVVAVAAVLVIKRVKQK